MSSKRECGGCNLCCTLLPVRPLNKGANERCAHQCAAGCGVYQTPTMPADCRLWTCRWLVDGATARMQRPDAAHYVVDVMPDFVQFVDKETGDTTSVEVIQIWVDPAHPDAHRDPALRDYLDAAGHRGVVGLVRYNSKDGFALIPPSIAPDRQWHEMHSELPPVPQHSFADIMREIG